MEALANWLTLHAKNAHWAIFIITLLAGMNIPISIDLIMIVAALLAATAVPEHTIHLFLAVSVGCYFSAWIAYWIGRQLGAKLSRFKWFSRILHPERLEKIHSFYHKHGFWTLLVGRFIPFGVRNCIFMSTGMSRMPFGKFILMDLVACFVWSASYFYLFYTLGQNWETLYQYLKTFNILLFSAFTVTVIGIICYKWKKKKNLKSLENSTIENEETTQEI